jgi:hypothetical protein
MSSERSYLVNALDSAFYPPPLPRVLVRLFQADGTGHSWHLDEDGRVRYIRWSRPVSSSGPAIQDIAREFQRRHPGTYKDHWSGAAIHLPSRRWAALFRTTWPGDGRFALHLLELDPATLRIRRMSRPVMVKSWGPLGQGAYSLILSPSLDRVLFTYDGGLWKLDLPKPLPELVADGGARQK